MAAKKTEELVLRYVRCLKSFPKRSYLIFEDEQHCEYRIVSSQRPNELTAGLTYRLFGSWNNHPTYGQQFHSRSCVVSEPIGRKSTQIYLGRLRGMTSARAARIILNYGENSIRALRDNPDEVAKRCNMASLTVERCRLASEELKAHSQHQIAIVELVELFEGIRFRHDLPEKVLERLGNGAPQIIRNNPYRLLEFNGVGFGLADGLYRKLDLDLTAIERQIMCLWYGLHKIDGHTWVNREAAVKALRDYLGDADVKVEEAIRGAVERKLIKVLKLDGEEWFAEFNRHFAELLVAEHVADLARKAAEWPRIRELRITEHQAAALRAATRRKVGVLVGAPGTGKTYAVAQLITRIKGHVRLCAPTGKAANRLTEVVRSFGSPEHATTIHSLLGMKFYDDTSFQFVHNRDNPLDTDFVIVDEASMLDTQLLSKLVDALPDHCHLLLVGDIEQLPPIQHGAPMRDMIESGVVPVGELEEIVRNSGEILLFCRAVKNDERFILAGNLKLPDQNLMIKRISDDQETINYLKRALTRIREQGRHDAVWDVQIIVPTNVSTRLGRIALNAELQEVLNERNKCEKKLWPEDKVICLKNSWLPVADPNVTPSKDTIHRYDDDGELLFFVANGELGTVVDTEGRRTFVEFNQPTRNVIVPESEDGEPIIDLGYAITGHKSQGSEWPIVIVILDGNQGGISVQDRSWLYTVVSRAKLGCILIGSDKMVASLRRLKKLDSRQTLLQERLRKKVEDYARAEQRNPIRPVPGSDVGEHDAG